MRILGRIVQSVCVCAGLIGSAGAGSPAGAQTTEPNEWTWVGGSNTCCQAGNYGIEGVAAAANLPSGRAQSATATDSQGNLWLFGGESIAGPNNDLWELNSSTKQWVWVSGSNTAGAPGNWGVMGSAAAANVPSARNSAAAWIDSNGNFWLFGGSGVDSNNVGGLLNDLWEYTPATKQWTWMAGSNALVCDLNTVYNKTICDEPAVNGPGGRDGEVTWTDSQGNLWLFGGNSYDSSGTGGIFNDFWEYSTSSDSWIFRGGATQIVCINPGGGNCLGSEPPQPQYGTLGVPDAGNNPGGRANAVGWTDSGGNLWIYGGENRIQAGPLDYNEVFFDDVWKYDFSSNEWTWMAGANGSAASQGGVAVFPGVYGTLGVSATGNTPGSRIYQSTWTDKAGNFWLYGGVQTLAQTPLFSDIWVFNPSSLNWAWMGGSAGASSVCSEGLCQQPAVYGALGAAAASNSPGGRGYGNSWTDSAGNFWLFGGGYPAYPDNDLWEYQPSANSLPPAITPVFNPPAGAYTSTQSVTISNGMSNASIYYTTDGTTPTSGSILYTGPVTVSGSETIKAIAIANGYPNSGLAIAAFNLPAATPAFSVAAGTYTATQSIAISDATAGVTIYYTTNGTTPTASSAVYSGAISVSATETIEAIAVAAGFSASSVASATYTINLPPPTFTIAGTAVSVAAGATSGNTSAITLTPANGFTGSVGLTAAITSSPANAVVPPTLSFGTTNPVAINGTMAGTATLTISTTAASSPGCTGGAMPERSSPWYAGGAALACMMLIGIPARRRSWRTSIGMLTLLIAFVSGVAACGSGGGGTACSTVETAGTTAGEYVITVTGTSGSTTETGTVQLTVQ